MAIFIPANINLPMREVQPTNGREFQLAQLYELLSCTSIETLTLSDRKIMVIDEEGKYTKTRNERATQCVGFATPKQYIAQLLQLRESGVNVIWGQDRITDMTTELDFIAGDAMICEGNEIR